MTDTRDVEDDLALSIGRCDMPWLCDYNGKLGDMILDGVEWCVEKRNVVAIGVHMRGTRPFTDAGIPF
jgi:hypothetical protein